MNARRCRAPQPWLALLGAASLAACASTPTRRAIHTPAAPQPIGPYAQGVMVGDTLWAAGQLGLDPESRALVPGGIAAETAQALANLGAVLQAAGLGFGDVVQVQVFLADLGDFPAMNEVYARCFTAPFPARTTVAANLPRGARVEIALVAVRPQ